MTPSDSQKKEQPFLILISNREKDVEFFSEFAMKTGYGLVQAHNPKMLTDALSQYPKAVVLWDASRLETDQKLIPVLQKSAQLFRVFALLDPEERKVLPALKDTPCFQHVIYRGQSDAISIIFERIFEAASEHYPLGLQRYFPDFIKPEKILIKRSSHRQPAVDAIQNFLGKTGVRPRLAALVAQATDELLLNAIFLAPRNPKGEIFRKFMSRTSDFDFGKNEVVQVELARTLTYVGISVTDYFGSLSRETVLRVVSRDYREKNFVPKSNEPGLGIPNILGKGLSLVIVSKPTVRTDAMIFFPLVDSHSEMKKGFQVIAYFGGTIQAPRQIIPGEGR